MIRPLFLLLLAAISVLAAEDADRAKIRVDLAQAAGEASKVSRAFNLVHQYAAPSVVSIHTGEEVAVNLRIDGRIEPGVGVMPIGEGSGFIARSSNTTSWVVTNAHVVVQMNGRGRFIRNQNGLQVYNHISIGLHDGRMFDAELGGIDSDTDLAVLKIPIGGLSPVEWDDSDKVLVGDFVLALGYPFGKGYSATSGIVSATDRSTGIYSGMGNFESFIQTDAAINPGNSGGPLFNLYGHVIGVNSNIYSPTGVNAGLGFAISSNLARRVSEDLMDHGKVSRPMVGVEIDPDFDKQEAAKLGVPAGHVVRIKSVLPESPAEQGGLRNGDVILTFNKIPIEGNPQFRAKIASVRLGDSLDIEVWREGKIERALVKPIPKEELDAKAMLQVKQSAVLSHFGLLFGTDSKPGLPIIHVEPNSVADQKGLESGDRVLKELDQGDLKGLADLAVLSDKREVMLQVLKEGRAVWVKLRR